MVSGCLGPLKREKKSWESVWFSVMLPFYVTVITVLWAEKEPQPPGFLLDYRNCPFIHTKHLTPARWNLLLCEVPKVWGVVFLSTQHLVFPDEHRRPEADKMPGGGGYKARRRRGYFEHPGQSGPSHDREWLAAKGGFVAYAWVLVTNGREGGGRKSSKKDVYHTWAVWPQRQLTLLDEWVSYHPRRYNSDFPCGEWGLSCGWVII